MKLTSYFFAKLEASVELDFGSQFVYDYLYVDMGYHYLLSETEMIGRPPFVAAHEWPLIPLECLEKEIRVLMDQVDNDFIVDHFRDDFGLGLCNVLSVNGPSGKVFNEVDSTSYGLDLQCINDMCDKLEVSMSDANGNLGVAGGFNGFKPSRRRRKKSKKCVVQLVYDDKAPDAILSLMTILSIGI